MLMKDGCVEEKPLLHKIQKEQKKNGRRVLKYIKLITKTETFFWQNEFTRLDIMDANE